MKINGEEKRLNSLREEIKKAEKELTNIYKERDKALSSISDQRQGKSSVIEEKGYYERCIEGLQNIFNQTNKTVKENKQNFYKLTDKQINKIQELNNKINKKAVELSEYEKKEIIDIDGLNQKYKASYNEKLETLNVLNGQIADKQKERALFEKKAQEEQAKLNKQRDYQEKVKQALLKRETDLKRKEERLKKLHLSIKGNNNG